MRSSRASAARAVDRTVRAAHGTTRTTPGAVAAESWRRSLDATTPELPRWHVEIALDTRPGRAPTEFDEAVATRFHLDIYAEEWGIYFLHAGRASWIRVTDVAFVHGRDEYQLLATMPALRDVGTLVRALEQAHGIRFQRQHAAIRTNLAGSEPAIRRWVAAL